MSDATLTPNEKITYDEVKEPSFLEDLLRRSVSSVPAAVTFTCSAICIALAIYHLYIAAYGTPEGRSFRSIHLTVMLVVAILTKPLFRASHLDPIFIAGAARNWLRACGFGIDMVFVLAVLFIQAWTLWDIDAFHYRFGEKELPDLIVGGVFIALVLECTRRAVGMAMVCVTGFFVLHTLYTPWFFGIFYGPPTSFGKFVDVMFMGSDGIFGIPLHVAATYIVLFIIFGALLIRTGAGKVFIELAVALTGHRVGGPAKAATLASGFMGTVSGSAVANVVTTGSFTIPLMKKLGYRPKFAAAVEACASSGGQITPPIMGAAAFIIAENLQIGYASVIVAAAIPAFLYFATVYFMVHFEAEKHGIGRIPRAQLPDAWEVFKRGWHLMLALVVLITILLMGYTPMKSAFWGILALVALSFINRETRMSPADILAALESGVRSTVPVTIACACAGLLIGSVFASGFGLKFTNSVIVLADGSLPLLLGMTAVAAILLGMGMTTTAVYITVAALIVPSLEKIGVNSMAAHMFAFYFGVVSSITPPVALASFAGAAIAGTPPMATAVESSKIGIAKYLVPFVFIYNPAMLFEGTVWAALLSGFTALVAMWVLSAAVEGWLHGRINALTRLVLFVSAVCILVPTNISPFGISGWFYTIGGIAVAVAIVLMRRKARQSTQAASGDQQHA